MGSRLYPKVHQHDKTIIVYSREPWGVILTNAATGGTEWQLFLLGRSELSSFTPWKVKSLNKHDLSATIHFTNNPVETYSNIISQRCPSYVNVDAQNTITTKK